MRSAGGWICTAWLGSCLVLGCGGDDTPPVTTPDAGMDGASSPADGGGEACRIDDDCSDGIFCNGEERCVPGDARADGRGCAPAPALDCDDAVVCTLDSCSEEMGMCRHTAPDLDGDGHGDAACTDADGTPIGDDCDDSDARAFPGNAEVCDGHDEDCNPDSLGFLDGDGDGSSSSACCNGATCGPDCNDSDSTIRPGIADGPPMACDTIDNDCDGASDEGCPCVEGLSRECGTDTERMRIGECRPGTQFCVGGAWTETCTGGVHPDEEICDTRDNDCDGMTDESVERSYYPDVDGDGFGAVGSTAVLECSAPMGYAALATDCDDTNAAVNPGAPEVCNGVDDNCAMGVDEGGLRTTYYRDADGDGFGNPAMSMPACVPPMGYVAMGTDCNDAEATVHPGASDVCNMRDDDCDGTPDPMCACTDGATRNCGPTVETGECAFGTQRCIGGAWAECIGAILAVPEVCNGRDDDCDAMTDDGVLVTYYRDTDRDGFGAAAMTTTACSLPAGYSTLSTDCNDADGSIHPASFERCDAAMIDEDCDTLRNEGCACTDGATRACGPMPVGVCRPGTELCVGGVWSASCAGSVGPTPETCDGLDNDCNAAVDNGVTVTCYADADTDGYGTGSAVARCPDPARTMFGNCPVGYSNVATDCNDASASVRPGATEVCNGIDDNCAGGVDDGVTVTGCYVDADSDTYGAGTASTQCLDPSRMAAGYCPAGYYNRAGDCNDARATQSPAASESCNAIDDDCDGTVDDGVLNTYFRDADRDGYGASSMTATGCMPPAGYVAASGDCNDTVASIYPGAAEICDTTDQDCTPGNEPLRTFYRDFDGDLYGTSATTTMACAPPGGYVEYSGDCNDVSSSIHPGATEICNGADDDCDGAMDEAASAQCFGQYPFAVHVTSWACTAGACVPSCETTWRNCDSNLASGCEVNSALDLSHCGMCGNSCGTGGTCSSGTCDTVADLAAGAEVMCARRSNGRVACWGNGDNGEIGDSRLTDALVPTLNPDLFDIDGFISVAHTAGVNFQDPSTVHAFSSSNFLLYGWGRNQFGMVGDGTMITPKATPAVVTIYPTAWTRIAGGSNHTCGVRSTGVYCWGDNTIYGMHGDGSCTTSIRWSPPGTIVPGSSGATDVAAGLWFNCMVTAAGGVQCWGIRRDGRMGDAGAIGDLCQPSPIGVVLPVGFIAADVEIGTDHACALSTGGVAACWGDNEYGQLGDGTRVDRNTAQVVGGALTWAQISAGVDHTCGRTTAGRIYCWGRDTYGEIGNGIATDALGYVAPQAVGAATNWIDIASGDDHVCALNSTSDVYCWGRNAQGQLGLGDTTNRDTPILVPTI